MAQRANGLRVGSKAHDVAHAAVADPTAFSSNVVLQACREQIV